MTILTNLLHETQGTPECPPFPGRFTTDTGTVMLVLNSRAPLDAHRLGRGAHTMQVSKLR